MNLFKKQNLVLNVYVAAALGGMAAFATQVEAATVGQTVDVTKNGTLTDEQLTQRVAAALHADRYFPDQHVTVSVEKGAVVLHGFVFGDWDLQRAIRIAGEAAGHRLVIDDLSIKEGGR